jgi:hypothetical protein
MTDWEPCTLLVGEPDYWDPSEIAIRRRLSGVAQALQDVQAVAVHFERDPDAAIAEWESYARAADDDGMATFNAWVKDWEQRSRWGRFWPLAANPVVQAAGLGRLTVPVSGRYVINGIFTFNAPPMTPRLTAGEIRQRLTEYAAQHDLDADTLWADFDAFWTSCPEDLETCYQAFLGQRRLQGLVVQIGANVGPALDAFSRVAKTLGDAFARQIGAKAWALFSPQPGQAPAGVSAAMIIEEADLREAVRRRCYRCAQDHGSRPCQKVLRGKRRR